MHESLEKMLEKYDCRSGDDYINALKEIIQEISLYALWRHKFFEHAAFYGGTSLRILYGLNRFSEDLDFSLLAPNNEFSLEPYNNAIQMELKGFGLETSVESKNKTKNTNIVSAFIKGETKIQLIHIRAPESISQRFHHQAQLKIKMEVDVNPPKGFLTEAKTLMLPAPFSVNTYRLADIFAGKIHALLCREWGQRVKGRDWFDFAWFVANKTPVHLNHLRERLVHSGHLEPKKNLNQKDLIQLLNNRIEQVDFEKAKKDVINYIKDSAYLDMWSASFFKDITQQINTQ